MQNDSLSFRPIRIAWATATLLTGLCAGLTAAPAEPTITATKDDGVIAGNKKPAGSTVTYTNTLTNTAGPAATGVQFKDPDIANAVYASNSLKATPVAVDDTYTDTVIANSSINTATGGFSVLTNDFMGYAAGSAVTLANVKIASVTVPAHGTVSMTLQGAGVGQFTYTPTPGYTGPDSFSYVIDGALAGGTLTNRTSTVNLTVGGPVIWFVDPTVAAGGTGALGSPFNSLSSAVTAIGSATNHRIFVYSTATALTTATTLNSGGWLVGQAAIGTDFETLMGGITYPAATTTARPLINQVTKPSLTCSTGNTLTLGNNSVVLGVALANTGGGYAVSGGNTVGTGQIGNASTVDVTIASSGSSSGAFSLNGGSGSITINAPITTTGGHSVNIAGRTGGTISFPKLVSDTDSGTGILLTNNSGAAIAFSGGLTLTTTTNTAFAATGGGTVTATQDNSSIINAITTTTATALNVTNTNIGAGGLTFRSISSNGGTSNGIILDTTGASGGLTVTGDGSNLSLGGNNSGGTIQNKNGADNSSTSGVGIYLNNTANVVLRRMTLNGTIQNFGIRGFTVNGFTMEYCTVGGTLGTSNSGIGEGGVYFGDPLGATGVTGAAVVTNCNISGGRTDNFSVHNTSGTLNRMTITGSTFGLNQTGANDSLAFEARNSGTTVNATVTGCTFTGAPGDLASFVGQINAAMDVVFQNNTCTNSHSGNIIGGGGLIFAGFTSTTINVSNNTLRDADGSAITLQLGAPVEGLSTATSFSGTVNNNTIGVTGVADSGSKSGNGIFFSFADNSTAPKGQVNLAITNNIIRRCSGNAGIYADNTGGNYDLKLTCTGNTVAEPGAGSFAGFALTAGSPGSTDDIDVFAKITGNNFSDGDPANSNDIIVGVSAGLSSMKLAGTSGPADGTAFASTAAVQSFLLANNNTAGTVVAAYTDSPATNANFLGAGATNPPLPSTLLFASGGIEAAPVVSASEPVVAAAVPQISAPVAAAQIIAKSDEAPGTISQADLDAVVSSAIARWEATGLTDQQIKTLRSVQFEIAALPDARLGEAGGDLIRVDADAGGNGWFIEAGEKSDAEFSSVKSDTRRYTASAGLPAGRVDLLTTVMHEMGHALGLSDTYNSQERENIMFGQLTTGERRVPVRNQASGLAPFTGEVTHFLSGGLNPINIGTLPAGKSVDITYDVTIDNPFALGQAQLSSQATVTGTNFTQKLTNDPETVTADDATITLLDRPDTTVVSLTRQSADPNKNGSVTWQIVFANAVTGLTKSNFSLVNTGLGGSPAIGSVTETSGPPSTTWNITVSTGTGDGSLGLNLVNDAALSHDVTNLAYTGEVYTIDKTPPSVGTPDLVAASDSGVSSSDNLTNIQTPNFTGTAEAGSTVTLYDTDGTTVLGTTTANGTGKWTITSSTLSEGVHMVSAKATDAVGNVSAPSSKLTVTIVITPPSTAPDAPTLDPATDSGFSNSDRITNFSGPDLLGTGAISNIRVNLYSDGTLLGNTLSDGSGNYTYSTTFLADGTHVITSKYLDNAGNIGGASAGLSIIIDTEDPTISIGSPSVSSTTTGPVTYTLTYSDGTLFDTSTLVAGNITLDKTGTADGTVSVSNITGTTCTVTISSITGGGTMGISVASGALKDLAGNGANSSSGTAFTVIPLLITPSTASLAQNATQLIISGVGFSATAADNTVTLSSGNATVTSATTTQLTCTLGGSPSLGALNATVDVASVGSTGPTQVATIVAAATVTSISPTAGPTTGGTSVTITGTNFTGTSAVNFGATPATAFSVDSATSITATSPAGTGTVDVRITAAGGISATSAADQFTSVPAPMVTSISPTAGPATGGTTVTITGTDFGGTTAVTFGATPASGFTVNSATSITATSPAGIGTVDVRITTAGGTSATSAADQFTYVPAPTITGISPTAGPTSGGSSVTITGTNFSGATAVNFGAAPATSFTVNSATTITATSPAGTGTVDVRVTTVGGTSATSAADQFTYVAAPTVASISPTAGPTAGGTSVTITGTNFSGATAVTFGVNAATGFTVNSATSITATSPAGTGTVDVRVTTVGGNSAISAADQFTYVPAPTVTGVSPTAGPATGSTSVVITGTNFSGATVVTFGATAATGFTVNSGTTITATSPAGTGTVDVRITTAGGTSATSAADQFTYVPAPIVTSISPTAGPATGSTTVVITGTNFSGATAVTFGATAATGFTVNSGTSITATSPAGTGTVDVRVTTVGGTSATSAADQFTYVPAPTVTSISPTSGPSAGGSSVTINGTNFTGATAVNFGATPATGFTVNSGTSITATSPAGTGTVDVRVTTVGGTSSTSAADQFTFASADLTITKTDGVTTATSGGSVTYTITASNAGPSNVTGATVADTLPATLTGTWSAVVAGGATVPATSGSGNISALVNLPAGGSVTYTVVASISPAATGTLSNTATITAPDNVTDPVTGNNSATDTDTLVQIADLGITKTDGVTTATPGGSVTYTITASNAGPSNAPVATVADTLPGTISGATWTAVGAGGGTATASGSGNINDTVNLPAGGSVTYTVTAPISAAATGTLTNTATVTSAVTDPTPGNNSASDTDTLTPNADLAITKTDGVTSAVPGNSVTYTITASNAGPSNVTGATVADTLPSIISGATWTAVGAGGGTATASGSGNINDTVNLPAGASVTYTVTAPISAAATGTLSNTATISSSVADPTPGNNSATDTDTLTPNGDLAITKTDGVTSAIPGNSVTYTITASNSGPSNVTGATVADTLPASISGATWTAVGTGGGTATASGSGNINEAVNLPVGGSVTYTVTAPISVSATGTLVNTATIGSAVTDTNPANNSATDTDTLTPQADLAVTLSDSPDPVNALGNLTYTITLTSTGPSTAVSPTVTLPLPASTTFVSASAPGIWTTNAPAVGGTGNVIFSDVSLAPGESATFTVVAKVDITVVNDSILTGTATASSATTDPAPGNNSATTTTLAKSGADLQLTLSDSPDPVIAGTELTYTIQIANNGPLDAENISISDVLPAGTTFVSVGLPAGWSATTPAIGANGTVVITNPLFANAGTATFTLVAKVASSVASGTSLSDTATVSSTTVDIVPGNNSATTLTDVTIQSDLAVDLTGTPATAPKGSNVTYAITLTNHGPSDASSPVVSLPLPSQMTFVSLSAPGGWVTTAPAVGAGGTVGFSATSLPNGATATFTVVAKVKTTAPNGTVLLATAVASATGMDPVPASNSDSTTAAVGTVSISGVQPITTGIGVTSQTGLFDVTVNVTNTTPLPINGFRLHVDFSAYKAAYPSLRLYNASSAAGASDVYIDYPFPVSVDALVAVKLSFYTSTRTFPSPFKPKLTVEILPTSQVTDTNGSGVQPRLVRLADTNVLLEFPSKIGRWYRVRFSSDMVHWQDCPVPLQAGSTRMQWIDSGPPFTDVPPAQAKSRFYLVNEIAAP